MRSFKGSTSTIAKKYHLAAIKQVIQVKKLVGLPPPHSNYLGVFLRFRRTFTEVITFDKALAHEF